jgi:hypothetical protein
LVNGKIETGREEGDDQSCAAGANESEEQAERERDERKNDDGFQRIPFAIVSTMKITSGNAGSGATVVGQN